MAATVVAPMERAEHDRDSIQTQQRDSSPSREPNRESSQERNASKVDLLEDDEDLGHRKDWPENTRLEQWMMSAASDTDSPAMMLRRLLHQNPGYGGYLAKDEDLALVVRISARRLRALLLSLEGEVIQQDVLYQPLCELCWRTVGLVLSSVSELGDLSKRALPRDAAGQLRMLLHTNMELSRKLSESRRAYLRELSEHRDRQRRLPPEAVRAVQSLREQPVMFYEPLSFVLDETTKDFVRQTVEERLKLGSQPGGPLKAVTPFEATREMKNKQKNMLEQEIRSLKKSLANEAQARKQADGELIQLKFSYDELLKEKEDIVTEKAEQEVQLEELDSLKKQAAIDAQAARNNAAKLEEQHRAVNDVKRQLGEQKKRAEQLQASEADFKHKHRQAETEVARLNEKLREFGNLSKVRDEIVEVNKKLQRAEKEIQKRTSVEGDLRKTVHDLRIEVRNQKEEIDSWAERYDKDTNIANEALASAKRSLSVAQEEHRHSYARAQAEVAHLQLLLERSEEHLNAQQASKDNLLAAASTFRFEEKTQVLESKAAAQDASTRYRELQREHGELNTNFQILKGDHDALHEAHTDLDNQHTDLSKKHKDLAQRFADLWEEKKRLEKKLESMLERMKFEGKAAETDLQRMHQPRQVHDGKHHRHDPELRKRQDSEDSDARRSLEGNESVQEQARASVVEVLQSVRHSMESDKAESGEAVLANAKQQVENLALLAGLSQEKVSGMLQTLDALDTHDTHAIQDAMAVLQEELTEAFRDSDGGSSSKGSHKAGDLRRPSWTHWEGADGDAAHITTTSDFAHGAERREINSQSSQSDMSSASTMFRSFKEGLEGTTTTSAGDTRPSEAHTQQNGSSSWLPDPMPSSSSSRKNAKRGSRTRFGKSETVAFGDKRNKGSKDTRSQQAAMSSSAPHIGPHSLPGSERGSSSSSSPELPAVPGAAAPPPRGGAPVRSSTTQAVLSTSRQQFQQEGGDALHSHGSKPPPGQTLAPLSAGASKAPDAEGGQLPKPAKGALKRQATVSMAGTGKPTSQGRPSSLSRSHTTTFAGKKRPGLADLEGARGSSGSKGSSADANGKTEDEELQSSEGRGRAAELLEFSQRSRSRGDGHELDMFAAIRSDLGLAEGGSKASTPAQHGSVGGFEGGLQHQTASATKESKLQRQRSRKGTALPPHQEMKPTNFWDADLPPRIITTLLEFLDEKELQTLATSSLPPELSETVLEGVLHHDEMHETDPESLRATRTSMSRTSVSRTSISRTSISRTSIAQDAADGTGSADLGQAQLSSRLTTPDLDSLGVLAEVVMRNTVSFWSHEVEKTKAIQKQAIQALKAPAAAKAAAKAAAAADILAHVKEDLERDLPSRSASGGRADDAELLEFPRRANPERDEGSIWDQVRSDLGLEEQQQQQPPEE